MSADILHRAATQIREDYSGENYTLQSEFMWAVADLLEALANRADEIADTIGSPRVAASVIAGTLPGYDQTLAVARAYLGESDDWHEAVSRDMDRRWDE